MADKYLESIGYTEHGMRHCDIVSRTAQKILRSLSYDARDVELAAVAGFLHDIGNMAGREQHHRLGALLAKEILEELGFDLREIGRIMAAIVIHEEDEGVVKPDPVAAALLIADKSDVHRSRVRNPLMLKEDIHDRVNYAVTESELLVDAEQKTIRLLLLIDTHISHVIEYFEIFLSRMVACRKAAQALDVEFQLFINDNRMA
jgi:putative nucleotidyltransferase with HDIG domain